MKSTVQIYVLNLYNDEPEKIHTHLHPLYIYILTQLFLTKSL